MRVVAARRRGVRRDDIKMSKETIFHLGSLRNSARPGHSRLFLNLKRDTYIYT
jgi:hypothetical protein